MNTKLYITILFLLSNFSIFSMDSIPLEFLPIDVRISEAEKRHLKLQRIKEDVEEDLEQNLAKSWISNNTSWRFALKLSAAQKETMAAKAAYDKAVADYNKLILANTQPITK